MEGFQYVLQKQEQQKICFGSGCPRDTSRKGMNSFMKYFTLDDIPNIAPNSYNALQSFKAIKSKPCSQSISKKGYSGLARFGKKVVFEDITPSPFDYNISTFLKQVDKSKYPFGSGSKRKTFVSSTTPGPGSYAIIKEQVNKFEHSFGGKMKMKLGVDLKCCRNNTDHCKICNKRLTDDYWHFKNKIFLCRVCMNKQYAEQTKFKRNELKQFRKIRDCAIIHQHEDTTAKLWLMNPTVITKWIQTEAYLSTYLKE